MPAKFVVKKGNTGKFKFTLHTTNGNVVATSESYDTKASCMNGLRSVQKNAPAAGVEDQTTQAWAAAAATKKAATKKASTKKAAAKRSAAKRSATKKSATTRER